MFLDAVCYLCEIVSLVVHIGQHQMRQDADAELVRVEACILGHRLWQQGTGACPRLSLEDMSLIVAGPDRCFIFTRSGPSAADIFVDNFT